MFYTQQSLPSCVASADLLTHLPQRWHQGRYKTAGTMMRLTFTAHKAGHRSKQAVGVEFHN